jgi:hypothetical protein
MRSTTLLPLLILLLVAPAALAGQLPNPPSASDARSAGARWLAENQNPDGGWGSGGHGQRSAGQASDVATTALSVMALLRDARGSDAHLPAIRKGIGFVVRAIEQSPDEGPKLAGITGTQPQYKLGANVDTHFAALLLGEIDARVGQELYDSVQIAYDKALTKVVAAQRADGSFDADGWAPVLSSSVAARSLYEARARGKGQVSQEVLEKNEKYNQSLVDTKTGRLDASAGAGVDLYAAASSLSGNRNAAQAAKPSERDEAEAAADKTAEVVRKETARMIQGFGSVGGEEMLSYMMISDTLAQEGGNDWEHWQNEIGTHLSSTQNADGSWSGHHCITSTPFVTAAAVMTLGSEATAPATLGLR